MKRMMTSFMWLWWVMVVSTKLCAHAYIKIKTCSATVVREALLVNHERDSKRRATGATCEDETFGQSRFSRTSCESRSNHEIGVTIRASRCPDAR